MNCYSVYFESHHGKYPNQYWRLDVFAKNATEACNHVLNAFYYDSYKGHHFYPFKRHAKRIAPDAKCDKLLRTDRFGNIK